MDSSVAGDDSGTLQAQLTANPADSLVADRARWLEWWRSYMHTTRNLLQQQQVCVELLQLRVQDRPESQGWFTQLQAVQDQMQQFHDAAYRYAAPLTIAPVRADLLALWSQAWLQAPLTGGDRPRWLIQPPNPLQAGANRPQVRVDPALFAQAARALLQLLVAPETTQVQLQIVPGTLNSAATANISGAGAGTSQGRSWDSRLTVRPAALSVSDVEASFTPFARRHLEQCLGPAQAHRIIHAHGGRVRVYTADEQGVTIAVELPEEPA